MGDYYCGTREEVLAIIHVVFVDENTIFGLKILCNDGDPTSPIKPPLLSDECLLT